MFPSIHTHTHTHSRTLTCSLALSFSLVISLSRTDQSYSDRSSDGTGHAALTRIGTGTQNRRGILAVEVTTSSMIIDLQKKNEESNKQATDTFDKELSSMDTVLENAKELLEDGGTLTIPILNALIKSKGSDPPEGRKKAPFQAAWKKVEHKPNWIRTVFFSEQDKKELQVLEDDNLKMKNRFNIHTYQYKLSSDTS